jgi:hypothetical protein
LLAVLFVLFQSIPARFLVKNMAIAISQQQAQSPAQMRKLTDNGRLCVQCKGARLLCGLSQCPILDRIEVIAPKAQALKKDVFGPSPPNLFVGRAGYPEVYAGPLVSFDDSITSKNALLCDDPSNWFGTPVKDIISFRAAFARGMQRSSVRKPTREMEELSFALLAESPVDMEVSFAKVPSYRISFSEVVQPMGPSGPFSRLRLASNPRIPKKTDSLMEEDLDARTAVSELLEADLGSYYIQKLLSAGLLGKKGRKKMVPTRWSITASDKIVADLHLDKVRTFQTISEVYAYSSEYLCNRFEILLLPGAWEFEQFECWTPGTAWNAFGTAPSIAHEYEGFGGRSDYAKEEGGGYYAGRIAAAEALLAMGRQAKAVIIREIDEGYDVPVGVWEVRENARNAFRKGADAKFAALKDALAYLAPRLKSPVSSYLAKSRIMGQTRLSAFF